MIVLRDTSEQFKEKAITMTCHGETLYGVLHTAPGSSDTAVLIVVGGRQYRCGAHRQFVLLAREFAQIGIPCLRFDVRGMGDSTGEPRHFLEIEDDIKIAIDALVSHCSSIKYVKLWGLCDGATAAIIYATKSKLISSVMMVNPWITTEAGRAKAELKQYYIDHFKSKRFWKKLVSSDVNLRYSLKSFIYAIGNSTGVISKADSSISAQWPNVVFEAIAGGKCAIHLVYSSRDLTAREFEDEFSSRNKGDSLIQDTRYVITHIESDHTFSSKLAQEALTQCAIKWAIDTS